MMARTALAGAGVALPELPHPECAATGPAGGNFPHIVTPCNAKPRLSGQALLSGRAAGRGSWSPWNCPLPWREFLPPDAVEGIEGLGHDARGERTCSKRRRRRCGCEFLQVGLAMAQALEEE